MARLYFEKICQDVFHLPLPDVAEKTAFLEMLLTPQIPAEAQQLLPDIRRLAIQFDFLPPFPRSIKIIANVLISHLAKGSIRDYLLADTEAQEKNLRVLLILCYLYAFHFELYQLCVMYPKFYRRDFLRFCQNPFLYKQDKLIHPQLDRLVLRLDDTLGDQMAGFTEAEKLNFIQRDVYPNRNFRRVLLIRSLVADTQEVTEPVLQNLKL